MATILSEIHYIFNKKDAVGDKIHDQLAETLTTALRAKPIAAKIKDAMGKVKIPPNISTYKVPETNDDIVKAMNLKTKHLDINLQRLCNLLLKAASPMIHFIVIH